jgi:diacylglycerol kinase (ATP)
VTAGQDPGRPPPAPAAGGSTSGGPAWTADEVAVLVNPTAGRGRQGGRLDQILAHLHGAGRPVRILAPTTVEDALAACRQAVAGGAGALVAVGGDGTVHLGLQAAGGSGVPFGVVPAGTGNDFAEQLGVPADPVAAARTLAVALGERRTRPVDLALVDGPGGYHRYFGAVLGAGFDAIVNERANRMRWPKGPRRYDLAIFLELLRLSPRRYAITVDGRRRDTEAVLVSVGNTACYGGGMRICPAADPTDGLLDLVVVGPVSRTTFVRIKPRVYAGTHVLHRAVSTERGARIELAADGITAYADGERACPLPLTITAAPGALTFLG